MIILVLFFISLMNFEMFAMNANVIVANRSTLKAWAQLGNSLQNRFKIKDQLCARTTLFPISVFVLIKQNDERMSSDTDLYETRKRFFKILKIEKEGNYMLKGQNEEDLALVPFSNIITISFENKENK